MQSTPHKHLVVEYLSQYLYAWLQQDTHLSNLHTYQLTHKNSACTKELGTTETLPNQHEQTIL